MSMRMVWKRRNTLPEYIRKVERGADIMVDAIAKTIQGKAREKIESEDRVETMAMMAGTYIVTPLTNDYGPSAGRAAALGSKRMQRPGSVFGSTQILGEEERIQYPGHHVAVVGNLVHYAIFQHEGFTMVGNGAYISGIYFFDWAAFFGFYARHLWKLEVFQP